MKPPALDAAERAGLADLADVIAPAAHGLPSAGALGLAAPGGLADHVLAIRPALLPAVRRALATAPTEAALDALAVDDPAAFEAVLELVVGAWSLAAPVRAVLGYGGQEALALDRGRIGAEDELFAMMERPPFWRDAGDGTP